MNKQEYNRVKMKYLKFVVFIILMLTSCVVNSNEGEDVEDENHVTSVQDEVADLKTDFEIFLEFVEGRSFENFQSDESGVFLWEIQFETDTFTSANVMILDSGAEFVNICSGRVLSRNDYIIMQHDNCETNSNANLGTIEDFEEKWMLYSLDYDVFKVISINDVIIEFQESELTILNQ